MTSGEGETLTWEEYFRKLQAYLQWQTDQITALQRQVASLQQELASVKEQKGVRIDRIEYSFDQLKVEKLEGTLNIGVTPSGLQSVEDFAVNGASGKIGGEQGPVYGSGPFPGQPAPGQGPPGAAAGPAGGAPGGTAAGGISNAPGGTNGNVGNAGEIVIQPPGDDWLRRIGTDLQAFLDGDVAKDLRHFVEQRKLPLDAETQRLVLEDIRAQLDDRIKYYARQSGNRAMDGQSFTAMAQDIIRKTKEDIRIAVDQYMTGISPNEEDE